MEGEIVFVPEIARPGRGDQAGALDRQALPGKEAPGSRPSTSANTWTSHIIYEERIVKVPEVEVHEIIKDSRPPSSVRERVAEISERVPV